MSHTRFSLSCSLAFTSLAAVLSLRYNVPNNINENKLNVLEEDDDIQIVHLSKEDHPKYDFDAFGKKIKLDLTQNSKIVSNFFKSFVRDGENKSEISAEVKGCYYLHKDNFSSAAVHFCNNNEMHGFIFFETYVIEIAPAVTASTEGTLKGSGIPHVVKRNFIESQPWNFDPGFSRRQASTIEEGLTNDAGKIDKRGFRNTNPVIETALFFDEAAFKIFAPYFNYDTVQIRDMLLAYMNGVQALYHHPSTGHPIDLTLTRLEILKTQPYDLPHHKGEREELLDSFCDYNVKYNPESDENPEHWDLGLYVSGLDFYAIEKGKKSGVTMGLAVVGGVCQVKYACVIAEFGVTNIFGKPYPSAGFTSVFIMAHEIGHSLGMHHDGYTNDCPNDGFIMSPSRGVEGETLWSKCSAEVLTGLNTWATCLYDEPVIMNELDHRKFEDTPGVVWNLKKQCELLLKDQDAEPFQNQQEEEICKSIQCKTPHRTGFYFAGPAMEGTLCGVEKWCQGGECVRKTEMWPDKVVHGGWSDWKSQPCDSGCIVNAKGGNNSKVSFFQYGSSGGYGPLTKFSSTLEFHMERDILYAIIWNHEERQHSFIGSSPRIEGEESSDEDGRTSTPLNSSRSYQGETVVPKHIARIREQNLRRHSDPMNLNKVPMQSQFARKLVKAQVLNLTGTDDEQPSIGHFARQRSCNNPAPLNTNRGCDGLSYEVNTCEDYKICRNRRKTVEEYSSSKCKEFANYVKEIDRLGLGLQAPHEQDRPWMGCTIFCRRHDGGSYYTPRVELNDVGINPYFPDGTWCNYDGKYNYYCLQHHCLPENFQFNKNLFWKDDIFISQNAPPDIIPLSENFKKYLSTDLKGNPLLKTLTPESNLQIPEDAWANKDYIEIF